MGNDDFQREESLGIPLVPTDCAYARLNEYLGKLRGSKIEVAQRQGHFGGNLSVREVSRRIRNECKVEWGVSKRRFRKWGWSEIPFCELRVLFRVFCGGE